MLLFGLLDLLGLCTDLGNRLHLGQREKMCHFFLGLMGWYDGLAYSLYSGQGLGSFVYLLGGMNQGFVGSFVP